MKVEQEKLDHFLKTKGIKGQRCALCNENQWSISTQVFQAPEFDYKGGTIHGECYPMLALTCSNCGNTYFINALIAGLIDKEPPQAENGTESNSTESAK